MDDKYKRVSCNFYDGLEAYATLRKELNISFFEDMATIRNEFIKIKTLETTKEGEFLISENGLRIRLDNIVSVAEV